MVHDIVHDLNGTMAQPPLHPPLTYQYTNEQHCSAANAYTNVEVYIRIW